jgi:hypothetical protein
VPSSCEGWVKFSCIFQLFSNKKNTLEDTVSAACHCSLPRTDKNDNFSQAGPLPNEAMDFFKKKMLET